MYEQSENSVDNGSVENGSVKKKSSTNGWMANKDPCQPGFYV
jgi:hypothetical protein